MAATQVILDRFERALVVGAVGLALIAQGIAHEGFVCVLASGLLVALNFRLWRLIVGMAQQFPLAAPAAMMLKLPLLAGSVYLLLQLGQPWMVGLGVSNVFFGAVAVAFHAAALSRARNQRVNGSIGASLN